MELSAQYLQQPDSIADILEIPELPLKKDARAIVVRKRSDQLDMALQIVRDTGLESITKAVPKRQYEYLLGRLISATLLGEFGQPEKDHWIMHSGRRPLWPSRR